MEPRVVVEDKERLQIQLDHYATERSTSFNKKVMCQSSNFQGVCQKHFQAKGNSGIYYNCILVKMEKSPADLIWTWCAAGLQLKQQHMTKELHELNCAYVIISMALQMNYVAVVS